MESPAYYGFLNLINAYGLRVLEIPCDPVEGLNLDDLRAALGQHPVKACLMSTSVSNPLGVTLSVARKRELLEILGQSGVPLVEDATFGDLHFSGPPPAARSLRSGRPGAAVRVHDQDPGAGVPARLGQSRPARPGRSRR